LSNRKRDAEKTAIKARPPPLKDSFNGGQNHKTKTRSKI
jgi:hypothetical protein